MRQSAGILAFRRRNGTIEVLLLHLAGPLWAKKDRWHLPGGEVDDGEEILAAARREFLEEVGVPVPNGTLIDLGDSKQPAKHNFAWAIETDVDLSRFPDTLQTNRFTMEWPPRSGNMQQYPENDRAQWFTFTEAQQKVFAYMQVFLERLARHLGIDDIELQESPTEPSQTSLL